jgi:hypothetical protein
LPADFVCIWRASASIGQLVPDDFFRIPSSERSSAKSPCRQVNESSDPLQPLIIARKNSERNAIAAARAAAVSAPRLVNSRVRNIFNGFLLVPVNEKIPALNSI